MPPNPNELSGRELDEAVAHPPIPPNCEFFEKINGVWYFIVRANSRRVPVLIKVEDLPRYPHWLHVACPVAEVAWTKRSEMVGKEFDSTMMRDPASDRLERLNDQCADFMANALAWREWGAKEGSK